MHGATVGSYGGGVSYERGTPVGELSKLLEPFTCLLSSDDVFQETSARYRAVEREIDTTLP